ESDRLEWTVAICASAHRGRGRGVGVTARQDFGLRSGAPLEILIGLQQTRAGTGHRIGAACRRAREYLTVPRGGHLPWLGVARAYSELLLELQVRKAPHRLRSHHRLRRLFEEAPILLHGLIVALFPLHLPHVHTLPSHTTPL